ASHMADETPAHQLDDIAGQAALDHMGSHKPHHRPPVPAGLKNAVCHCAYLWMIPTRQGRLARHRQILDGNQILAVPGRKGLGFAQIELLWIKILLLQHSYYLSIADFIVSLKANSRGLPVRLVFIRPYR